MAEVPNPPGFESLEVIVLTSGGGIDDRERCDALRVAARLVKPVKQPELFEVVARVLGGAVSEAPGSGAAAFPDERTARLDLDAPKEL